MLRMFVRDCTRMHHRELIDKFAHQIFLTQLETANAHFSPKQQQISN